MAHVIRFENHRDFHRAALHMSVAGGMAGLAAHVLTLIDPRLGGAGDPLPLALVAGAALHGALPRELRARGSDAALVVLGASAAGLALTAAARGHIALGWAGTGYALAFGLLYARGLAVGWRWLAAVAAGGAAALLARFVLGSVAAAELGPAWVAAALSGAAFGGAALLGTLARHVVAARRLPGEVDEILARARASVRAGERAGDEPVVLEAIRSELARLVEVADRWQELERQTASSPRVEDLTRRLADLDRRVDSASDELARSQFEKARAEVALQVRELESIETARQRMLARMHHTLAAIERRRLGAAGADADCASQALIEADDVIHTVDGSIDIDKHHA